MLHVICAKANFYSTTTYITLATSKATKAQYAVPLHDRHGNQLIVRSKDPPERREWEKLLIDAAEAVAKADDHIDHDDERPSPAPGSAGRA